MKSPRIGIWAIAAALLITGVAWASGEAGATVHRTTGVIEKVDTGTNQLVVKVGTKTEEFTLAPSTRIAEGATTMSASQLAAGASVRLEWTMANGSRQLKSVEVVSSAQGQAEPQKVSPHRH